LIRIARTLANGSSPDAVQISEIVALAGVSRRTFYEHFASKEACFAELVRRTVEPVVEAFSAAAEKALPEGPTATFRAIVLAWSDMLAKDQSLFSEQLALSVWSEGLRPESPFNEAFSMLVDIVTELLVVAARRLESPLDDHLLGLAARQQVTGLIGMLIKLKDRHPRIEHETIAKVVTVSLGFPPEDRPCCCGKG
jgi:AcrR family transcriptional regulator